MEKEKCPALWKKYTHAPYLEHEKRRGRWGEGGVEKDREEELVQKS